MIGASAALLLARVPFLGPVGSIRLGRIEGKLVAFPTADELENSDLDLIVSSTEKAVVMIEGFGEELPEDEMAEAIMEAHRLNQELIALQKELIAAVGLPPHEHPPVTIDPLRQTIYERYGEQLRESEADRDEGGAQRGDEGALEYDHQRTGSGGAAAAAPRATRRSPCRPRRRSRRLASRPRSPRSRSGSSAS